jgi:uncharacterized membrane protein YtjA (UPF0391 family)
MLKAAAVLFAFSLLAGVLAFTGLAPTGGGVATISFFVLLVGSIVMFAIGMLRRRPGG